MIKYRKSSKYVIAEDITFRTSLRAGGMYMLPYCRLQADGTLTILEGFTYDGPSGPTIDTPDTMAGAAMHDAAYRMMREAGLDRLKWRWLADLDFARILIQCGCGWFRAAYFFVAVRLFGQYAIDHDDTDLQKVYEAPSPGS